MHSYERLVSLLLKIVMVGPPHYDNFVQRIGIYLLNSLACQVDNAEKELIGRLGAFTVLNFKQIFFRLLARNPYQILIFLLEVLIGSLLLEVLIGSLSYLKS